MTAPIKSSCILMLVGFFRTLNLIVRHMFSVTLMS